MPIYDIPLESFLRFTMIRRSSNWSMDCLDDVIFVGGDKDPTAQHLRSSMYGRDSFCIGPSYFIL